MTDDRMTLIEFVEKEADADLVREMLAFAADRIMDTEVEAVTLLRHLQLTDAFPDDRVRRTLERPSTRI